MINDSTFNKELEERVTTYLSKYGNLKKLKKSNIIYFSHDLLNSTVQIVNETTKLEYGRYFSRRVLETLPGDFRRGVGREIRSYLNIEFKKDSGDEFKDAIYMSVCFECMKLLFKDISEVVNYEGKNN